MAEIIKAKNLFKQQKYTIESKVFESLEIAIEDENPEKLRAIYQQITLFDVIDFLISTKTENRKFFFATLKNELDPLLLIEVDDDFFETLLASMEIDFLANLALKLDSENLIYFINRVSDEMKEQLIPLFPRFLQLEIYQNLTYPEESAGRLANKNFLVVLANWTVENVLDFFESKKDKITEKFHQIFVVDNQMRPLGFCELCDILFLSKEKPISEAMNTEIKTVGTEVEQEQVAHILRKYGLLSIPVVNEKDAIIGMISFLDIVDVVAEEADEDTFYLGGVSENDIHFSMLQTVKKRLPWLAINMLLASFTSSMIHLFDSAIEKTVVLAALMPLIASTGGNSGLQTVTVMIKSLANRDITKQNVWRIFIKEIFSGLFSGLFLALGSATLVFLIFHKLILSLLFGGTVISVFFISNFLATSIPLLLNHFKIDPAISSSIIITTFTDISSVLIFLGLASVIF